MPIRSLSVVGPVVGPVVGTSMGRARRLTAAALALAWALTHAAPASAQTVDEHYAAGVAAFTSGDFAKAVTEMNASLADHPTSKAALYLGNAHLKLGQLGSAKAALQRALELDPASPKRDAIAALIKGIDAAQSARVKVTSTPPGANVFVESAGSTGESRGTTPSEILLTPGRHELVVTLEGYEPEKRVQEFKRGDKVSIDVTLSPQGCTLALSAVPSSAKVSIGDEEARPLPLETRVGLGAHKVTFRAEGYEPKELAIDCDATKRVPIEAKLSPVVVRGRVRFASAAAVTVTVDGRVISAEEVAQGLALPVGKHTVTFSGGGRQPSTQIVDVAAGQDLALAPPPPTPAPPPAPRDATSGFPSRGIYLGLLGGANLPLIEWNLGSNTRAAYPKASGTGGVRAGVQLVPRLAVEAEAQWVGLPNRLDDGLGHGLSTNLNALFHVLEGRFTPVLEAGAGTYQVLSSDLGADVDLRLHAGVGFRGALRRWLVVRADVRDVVTDGFDKSLGNNLEVLLGVESYLWSAK